MSYIGEDGEKHRPVMVHRTVFGSIERFIGILTEHFGGAFPTWMAPVQAVIIPITSDQAEYAADLKADGVRVEVDHRSEKMGYKIREATVKKVPYMLVVGGKEAENGSVSLRSYKNGDEGVKDFAEFRAALKEEIAERSM